MARRFIIRWTGAKSAIAEAGYTVDEENPAYVVVSLDREVTYEMLVKSACHPTMFNLRISTERA